MSQKPGCFENLRIRTVKLLWKRIVGCRKLFVGCRMTKKKEIFLIGLELPLISPKPAFFA